MSIKHVKMSKDGVTTDVVLSAFERVWSKRGWVLADGESKPAEDAPQDQNQDQDPEQGEGESPLTGGETGSDKTSTPNKKKEAAQ